MRFTKYFPTAIAAVLAGCASSPLPPDSPVPAAAGNTPPPGGAMGTPPSAVSASTQNLAPARSWDEYRIRAAQKVVQASGAESFTGVLPETLESIPVLQVQLNRDGSVRNIAVLRTPRQSPQTLQMAMQAIRRAAPFGPVGHLPQPWQFNETFLYNEELKFQLRSLVEAQ